MKQRALAALMKMDPRLVWGGVLLLVALVAFESWLLVLRPPLAQYRQLRENRTALAAAVRPSDQGAREVARLAAEVQGLAERISTELRVPQSDDQLTAFVMTQLDRSAGTSGAVLKGVRPGTRSLVGPFEEVAYDVTAEGKYLLLCEWLLNLERELGQSAAITEFSMKTSDARQVSMALKVAFYRPAPPSGAGK